MFRSALVTILLNGGSTLLSFLNQLLIAAAFGASPSLGAYYVGISVPLAVASNLNQMLVYAVMPVLVGATRAGRGASLASAFFLAYAALAILLVLLGFAIGPSVVAVLGGVGNEGHLGMSRLGFLLYLGVGATMVLSGLLTAISNTQRSFAWPIVSGYGMAIGTTLGIVLLGNRIGPPAIAVGAFVGSAAGSILLGIAMRRRFARPPYPTEAWTTVRATLARSPIYLLGLLPFSALTVSDAFWGPRLGLSVVSQLGYANRILVNLAGVLMMGPVSVLAQRLSEHHAEGDFPAFRSAYAKGVRILLWFGGFACVLLVVLAEPTVRLLFQRGRFDSADTAAVAGLIRVMGVGLVGTNCAVLSFGALYARHAGGVAAALGVALCALYFGVSGGLGAGAGAGAQGIAWAYTLSWWAITLIAMGCLAHGALASKSVWKEGARLALTLGTTLAVAGLTSAGIGRFGDSRIVDLGRVVAAAGVGALAFGALAVGVLHEREVVALIRRLTRLRTERPA